MKQTYSHWISIKLNLFNLWMKVHPQVIFSLNTMTRKFQIPLTQNLSDCLLMTHCPWKHIYYIIPKLGSASYATRSVKLNTLHKTLRMIYYTYFHFIMNYGLLLWGCSSDSAKIFRLQKYIIRIMLGCRSRDSCRKLFKKLQILTLPSIYIYILFSCSWSTTETNALLTLRFTT